MDFIMENSVLKKYIGTSADVIIPDGVTEIGDRAFEGCSSLSSIVIPEGVTGIGDCAFRGCSNLSSVEIPEGVTSIGDHAFGDCSNLSSIVIPKSVTSIGVDAFGLCSSLNTIVIPEGVTSIGKDTFSCCDSLSSIMLPEGVTSIGASAFFGCSSLSSIEIPKSVTSIGASAFRSCRSLSSIEIPEGVTSIENYTFEGCSSLSSIVIPKGITSIGTGAFSFCRSLSSIEIPEGVTSIEDNTFSGCSSLSSIEIPEGITSIGDSAFKGCSSLGSVEIPENTIPIGGNSDVRFVVSKNYLQRKDKLIGNGFLEQIEKYWKDDMSNRDWAYIYLFQSGKEYENLCKKYMSAMNANELAKEMMDIILNDCTSTQYTKTADFILAHKDDMSPDIIENAYKFFKEKNIRKLVSLFNKYMKKDVKGDAKDPYSKLTSKYDEYEIDKVIKGSGGGIKLFSQIKLADSDELAPAKLVKCAAALYLKQLEGLPRHISEYKTEYVHFSINKDADNMAKLLDMESLRKLLDEMYQKDKPVWFAPYCRYGDGKQISRLISDMNKWKQWYTYGASGRRKIIVARGALMLSDTREAVLYMDKNNLLDQYAKMRRTNAETIRDAVLLDFGLDADGKKTYDIGSNKIVAALAQDLTIKLYDVNKDKVVKSIPKRGADEKLYEQAKADLADMKKNIKKVVKRRTDQLFEAFLEGTAKDAKEWADSYATDPLLKTIARILVWSQGKETFVLSKDDKLIHSDGSEYVLDKTEPVKVAHPIEMKENEAESWQKYFCQNSLQQPFEQVWEPVIKPDSISPDRYDGLKVPIFTLMHKEKHGVIFTDEFFHSELGLDLVDCNIGYGINTKFRHEITKEDTVLLGKFGFEKYTRYVNHIVSLFDRWTIKEKILNDDTSIKDMLSGFTLAQIKKFLAMAIENNCVNCTALLMDYKNKNYNELDTLEFLTLEQL